MNSKETAEILDLPTRFIDGVWSMLAQLNSVKRMIDVPSFQQTSKTVFQYFLEVIYIVLLSSLYLALSVLLY